jgi:glucokinase
VTGPAIGVDVGGTKLLGVLLEPSGTILAEARRATPTVTTEPGAAVAHEIVALLDDLGRASGRSLDGVALGVGVPGMLSRSGVLVFSPNLKSASGADLAGLLRPLLQGGDVVVANDADAAAIAEHRLGAARGVDDFVMVTLGTGIGGGIVAGGHLVRGNGGFAGEIGHVVVDPSGPHCPCGKRGCWERYASGAGVARLAREAAIGGRLRTLVAQLGDAEAVRGEDVTRAAQHGDAEALAVLEEVGWWLALGLANLAAVLDPACFVLGGGLSQASALLVPPTRARLAGLLEAGTLRPELPVFAAALGTHAGAVGAALLAMDGATGGAR